MLNAFHRAAWGTTHWRLAIVAAMLAAGATASAAATAQASPNGPAGTPRSQGLSLAPCHLSGLAQAVQCGVIKRPIDVARPDDAAFDLHVAVLPAVARHKLPDPVFFFAGGPGQSAIELASTVARMLSRFSARRDIVLIDQRGTGRSAALRCDDPLGPLAPLAQQLDPGAQLRRWADCRQALARQPLGDLQHIGTTEAVADVEAVRQALGLGPVNVVGVSYGTRVVLEYLRRFPQNTRRAVADGVVPADMGLALAADQDLPAALEATWAACAAEPACHARHPQLRAEWQALADSLPRTLTVAHPWTGLPETFTLSASMLQGLVRAPLYQPVLAGALPQAVAEARAGRWQALIGLALTGSGGGSRAGRLAAGMHFGVVCAEDAPGPASKETASSLRPSALYRAACAGWTPARVPADFGQQGRASQPVLLLSGAADPVTPPRHAERVAAALGPMARHRVLAQGGHGSLGLACVRDLVFRFVDATDDERALAAEAEAGDCGRHLPRPPFFQPPTPRFNPPGAPPHD